MKTKIDWNLHQNQRRWSSQVLRIVQRQCVTMTQRHEKSRCHEILPSMKMRNQDSRHQATYLVCPLRGSWPKLQSKVMMTAQTWHQIRWHTKKRQIHSQLKLGDYVPEMQTSIIESYITPKPGQLVNHSHQYSHLWYKKLRPQSMPTSHSSHRRHSWRISWRNSWRWALRWFQGWKRCRVLGQPLNYLLKA